MRVSIARYALRDDPRKAPTVQHSFVQRRPASTQGYTGPCAAEGGYTGRLQPPPCNAAPCIVAQQHVVRGWRATWPRRPKRAAPPAGQTGDGLGRRPGAPLRLLAWHGLGHCARDADGQGRGPSWAASGPTLGGSDVPAGGSFFGGQAGRLCGTAAARGQAWQSAAQTAPFTARAFLACKHGRRPLQRVAVVLFKLVLRAPPCGDECRGAAGRCLPCLPCLPRRVPARLPHGCASPPPHHDRQRRPCGGRAAARRAAWRGRPAGRNRQARNFHSADTESFCDQLYATTTTLP
jgi:hypothetical protein